MQPIYQLEGDASERQAVAFEALVRWQRGENTILPNEFLALAERSGAIIEIDRWVLEHAVKLQKNVCKSKSDCAPVHVNLCVQHLLRPRHIQALIDTATEAQAQFDKIVLEFGEEALQQEDSRRIMASLRKLKDAGFTLALDDFGRTTGPLHFIYNFPFDIIKLDRRFIKQVGHKERAQAMVRHIVTLCKDLNIELTAEGIETEEQVDVLLELGVRIGQGNLLGEAGTLPVAKPAAKTESGSKASPAVTPIEGTVTAD